jgi:hypothetical protein
MGLLGKRVDGGAAKVERDLFRETRKPQISCQLDPPGNLRPSNKPDSPNGERYDARQHFAGVNHHHEHPDNPCAEPEPPRARSGPRGLSWLHYCCW